MPCALRHTLTLINDFPQPDTNYTHTDTRVTVKGRSRYVRFDHRTGARLYVHSYNISISTDLRCRLDLHSIPAPICTFFFPSHARSTLNGIHGKIRRGRNSRCARNALEVKRMVQRPLDDDGTRSILGSLGFVVIILRSIVTQQSFGRLSTPNFSPNAACVASVHFAFWSAPTER